MVKCLVRRTNFVVHKYWILSGYSERLMLINVSFSIQNKGMPRLSNPVARQPEAFPVLDGRDTFKDTGYVSWRTYTSDVLRQDNFSNLEFLNI